MCFKANRKSEKLSPLVEMAKNLPSVSSPLIKIFWSTIKLGCTLNQVYIYIYLKTMKKGKKNYHTTQLGNKFGLLA